MSGVKGKSGVYKRTEEHKRKLRGRIPWNKGLQSFWLSESNRLDNPMKRPNVLKKMSETRKLRLSKGLRETTWLIKTTVIT